MSKGKGGGGHGKKTGGGGGGAFTEEMDKAGIETTVSKFADKQADRLFAGKVPTAAELKEAFSVPGVNTQLKVRMTPSGGMRVEIWGAGVMGERNFRRTEKGLVATHDSFYLQQHLQGKGTGSKLLAAQEAAYKRWGVKEIRIPRAAEVGRYFWAKKGFKAENMPAMRASWKAHLKAAGKSTKGADRASMKQIASHPEGKKFLMRVEPYSAAKAL